MHNAIATVSLFGTLEEKLRTAARAGFDSVEIFENDLIGPALSQRKVRAMMAAHGILCDEDADGRDWQLYTRAFDKRFFFEFVQRDGRYAVGQRS